MGTRQVFSHISGTGDIQVVENDLTREIGFITRKSPLSGGAKKAIGTVWLPAPLVISFVDSLQSLDIVVERRAIEAAAAAAAAAEAEEQA